MCNLQVKLVINCQYILYKTLFVFIITVHRVHVMLAVNAILVSVHYANLLYKKIKKLKKIIENWH